MNEQPSVYLTPHLYMTNEEVAIIDALIDHHEMPSQFDTNRVISYFEGENFCLVLYFADIHDRGFQKYVVNDFSVNVEDMYILSASLRNMIVLGCNVHLLSLSQKPCGQPDLYVRHFSGTLWQKNVGRRYSSVMSSLLERKRRTSPIRNVILIRH